MFKQWIILALVLSSAFAYPDENVTDETTSFAPDSYETSLDFTRVFLRVFGDYVGSLKNGTMSENDALYFEAAGEIYNDSDVVLSHISNTCDLLVSSFFSFRINFRIILIIFIIN